MDIRWISPSAIEAFTWSDVPSLLERQDGFLWVDIGSCDDEMASALADRFGFHDLAVRDILLRSHLPKIHAYSDHLFVVLRGRHQRAQLGQVADIDDDDRQLVIDARIRAVAYHGIRHRQEVLARSEQIGIEPRPRLEVGDSGHDVAPDESHQAPFLAVNAALRVCALIGRGDKQDVVAVDRRPLIRIGIDTEADDVALVQQIGDPLPGGHNPAFDVTLSGEHLDRLQHGRYLPRRASLGLRVRHPAPDVPERHR
jgi:hypothetical protein